MPHQKLVRKLTNELHISASMKVETIAERLVVSPNERLIEAFRENWVSELMEPP
jgi:hypothetical protein